MKTLFVFKPRYFILAIALFVIEVLIALFLNDRIIRPYVGDILVVIFLYCLLRSFVNIPVWPAAIAVLLFAFLIELLQYLRFVEWLGLQNSKLATVVLGSSFEWRDLLAYTAGIATVLIIEARRNMHRKNIQ